MPQPLVFTEDRILKAIKKFKRTYGRIPKMQDLGPGREPGYPSAQTVANRFGSFAEGVFQATGVRPTRGGLRG